MRSRPSATWTWLPLSAALLVAGCGAASWTEEPTPTPLATKAEPATTLVSADGETFTPGTTSAPKDSLSELWWDRVAVDDGRLVLRTRDPNLCARVDHVEVGPADGTLRRVAVRFEYPVPKCDERSRTLVLDLGTPVGEDTIVAPGELLVADGRLTAHRALAGGGGALQPDRRSVVTSFSYGSCEGLAAGWAKFEGDKIIVGVETGSDPDLPADTTCSGIAYNGHTLVRLPRRAPAGAKILAAWCKPGPRCSI